MSVLVLPGDDIPESLLPIPTKEGKGLKIGPGLLQTPSSQALPNLAGAFLTDNRKHAAWIEVPDGRYVPAHNDPVIVTVLRGGAENFVCTVTPHAPSVMLPHLAFESVSKKTRPQFSRGALVYARVSAVDRFFETELTCVDPASGKSEGLGELKGGMIFDISLGLARRLLLSKQREKGGIGVLEDLAEKVAFEIAVGRNGKVWVDSASVKDTLLIGKALLETDRGCLSLEAQKKLVRKLLKGR